MKTRTLMLIALLILAALLCGCNRYLIPYTVSDTPIYGTYSKTYKNEMQTLSLFNDNTYKYDRYNEDGSEAEYHAEGKFSDEVVNSDITKIFLYDFDYQQAHGFRLSFTNGSTVYKYKNLIGYYIKEELDIKSSFIIHAPPRGDYDYIDSYTEFNGKGSAQTILQGEPYMDAFSYKIKDNIIWVDFVGAGEYVPYYYIVCDGVFMGGYVDCLVKD